MRILFITRCLSNGGAERVTTVLANEFVARGHDVTLLTYRTTENDYPVNPRVQIVSHENKGVWGRIAALRSFVVKGHFDKVISLGSKYNYIYLSGIFSCSDVVLSERNDPTSFYSSPMKRFVGRCYSDAWGVAFQTNHAKECFSGVGIKRSAVIYNPVSRLDIQWDELNHNREVVNYCRFEKQKNLALLVKAFHRFHDDHPDYKLSLYGDGSQKGELQTLVSNLGLDDSVSIKPFCKDIHERSCQAEMFVSSSDYEGISNSMIESLLMGMPVVATDCGGGSAKEIIGDRNAGILVPRGSALGLARAMARIADSFELRAALSAEAKRTAELFEPEKVAEQWLSFLEEGSSQLLE